MPGRTSSSLLAVIGFVLFTASLPSSCGGGTKVQVKGSGGSIADGGRDTTGSGGDDGSGGNSGSGGDDGSGGMGGDTGSGGSSGSGGDAGSGGQTGSGGTVGSGGQTGSGGTAGAGGTTSVVCTGDKCIIDVLYKGTATADPTGRVTLSVDLINFGYYSAKLSQVTVRYWYTEESPIDFTNNANLFEIYYAAVGNANLKPSFHKVEPARPKANAYLELGFLDPSGSSFVETGNINVAFHKSNEGEYPFTQANDYSFDPTATAWTENYKVTAYLDGKLVFGTEPPLE